MKRFILTGTPGAGKTVLLRQLEQAGFGVVEEAAADVIALQQARGITEPWTDPGFIDRVVDLQRRRQMRAAAMPEEVQFHDRSAICTAALATYLGYPASPALAEELARIERDAVFERRVFLIRSLGFVMPTAARRITQEEAMRFEAIHERIYREHGFEIVPIDAGSVLDRAAAITRAL
ncbi:MAG: AAA family ATPase [Reyranella sp.]|uniref:AAA family ATPase n=1 Tax=Reyranella sp. TaxID=1929291 RepID=UPI003D108305